MAEKLKLFWPEWCEAAMAAVNASKAIYDGFKDPDSFTSRMEFGCLDHPDVVCHLEWEKAKVISWTPRKFDESDLWPVINGNVSTWKQAADGGDRSPPIGMCERRHKSVTGQPVITV